MAAYAAVVSLKNTIDKALNHPLHRFQFDTTDIEAIRSSLDILLDFLESNSHGGTQEAEDLEAQIASAVCEAEDVIESHIVDHIQAGHSVNGGTIYFADVKKVIESMESLNKLVMMVKSEWRFNDQPAAGSSRQSRTSKKNAMVGFDDEVVQLMDLLTGQQSSRQTISIGGQGGIGKTTLAKNVYENPVIVQHFDIRIWATVKDFSLTKIMLELLTCQGISIYELIQKSEEDIFDILYGSLIGKRYLIVLDDLLSVDTLEYLKELIPDNNNGSRIVVATRNTDLANDLGSSRLAMSFLDDEKSWNLFCQQLFSKQSCPLELVESGKQIVRKCNGIPLLIVLMAGHLRKCSKTDEYWERVADEMPSISSSDDEWQCFETLYLIYSYLPAHLKPCFLYMGVFPEYHDVPVHSLIQLWVAEGFIYPSNSQSLEEVAENYIMDLVDRNLILVRKWSSWSGKIKTCYVHDLLRYVCLGVGTKEKFFRLIPNSFSEPYDKERRLVIQTTVPMGVEHPEVLAMLSAESTRSVICDGGQSPLDYKLVRVIRRIDALVDEIPGYVDLKLEQYNVRLFHCNVGSINSVPLYIAPDLYLLWDLQTLIMLHTGETFAPVEFWKMPQLRYVDLNNVSLPDPPPALFVLQNLHTFSLVRNFRMSEDVCKRIPNIKKLSIKYDNSLDDVEPTIYYIPQNLGYFQKLESLVCYLPDDSKWRLFFLAISFPVSLRKLSLMTYGYLEWEDLSTIGSLPRLEVLNLRAKSNASGQTRWNPIEGEFVSLKVLKISAGTDLVYWNAKSCHFPVLEKLVMENFNDLQEIPSGIGEIPTLRLIRVKNCCVAVAVSAMRILVERERVGNEGLQLVVEFWDSDEYDEFKYIVREEGLSSKNLWLNRTS